MNTQSMEDKMAARAFGRATDYGWDGLSEKHVELGLPQHSNGDYCRNRKTTHPYFEFFGLGFFHKAN